MKHYKIFLLLPFFFYSCSKNDAKKKKSQHNTFYDKAFKYWTKGKIDSAFLYFNNAKEIFMEEKDSLNIGVCLLSMSIILTEEGDYFGGQETSLNAIQYFDRKDKNQHTYINSNFNNLGITNYKLKNYTSALKFYDTAFVFISSPIEKFLTLNNKAKTYEELKNYTQAIKIYNQVLEGSNNYPREFAMSLANVALTKWKQNPKYNPVPEYLNSLNIRQKENDYLGMNFCYAKLADYYSSIGDTNLALRYSQKMFKVNQKIKSPDDKLEALYKLVKYSPIIETKYYFDIYEKLDDSLRKTRASARNEFALIRYETEKNKSDFLKAQAENVAKQKNILIKNIGIAVLVAFLILSFFWYRRRQKLMKQEKEIEIKNTTLTYSKKVHDVVANRIYSVISEIEHREDLEKEHLLDKLDHIYQTSRDISYEITAQKQGKKFNQQLAEMLNTYVANPPQLKITGNTDELWATVSNNNKGEIFIILQELMTNMKKHSKATVCNIQFYKKDNFISILYQDNGIGLPKNVVYNNGLTNTETRIKNIAGTLTFENTDNLGLEILISFPVN